MSRVFATTALALAVLCTAGLGGSSPQDGPDELAPQLRRLESMPSDEQASLRALDAALSAAPREDQQRLENLLHRYNAWLSTLPASRRELLAQASPERRITLVENWREEARRRRPLTTLAFQDALQISALCPESIRRVALDLRLWFALDPRQRARIASAPTETDQLAKFRLALRNNQELNRIRETARAELGLELADLRDRDQAARRVDRARPALLKADQSRRLADWRTIRDLGQPDVTPANLERFESSLPPWVRRSLDPLPPDTAQRRLALLYRLTFPSPAELP